MILILLRPAIVKKITVAMAKKFCDSLTSDSKGVFCLISWWASTLMGTTHSIQVILGISMPIFLNTNDRNGAR